jgi:hypothetical protein
VDVTMTRDVDQRLWLLTLGPAIWGAHFLLSYLAASVWCSRFTADGTLGPIPAVVAAATAAALGGIALVAWGGWRRHAREHDDDTPEDRERFLGLATLLLAGLSAVATIYVAAAAFFFGTCR